MALPRRIGGSEWSHGGYPTLVAPTRWPEPFGAGATLAGMSDLRTFFAGTEPRDADVPVPESVQACPEPSARTAAVDLLLLPGEGHTVVGRERRAADGTRDRVVRSVAVSRAAGHPASRPARSR
jgi:dipeptidyl aminopeptidase/acylaminoacyl peptidase